MRAIRVERSELTVEHVGAILVRDLTVGDERWSKGRRLSRADLARLRDQAVPVDAGPRAREPGARPGFTLLLLSPDDVHEDEAALRLAAAVARPGTILRGPAESRVDLVAATDGILHVDVARLQRLNGIDSLEVFTLYDGQFVAAGELVASVKIAPHAVPSAVLEQGIAIAQRARGLVGVAPLRSRRVGVVAREAVRPVARERFEASVRAKVETLGSTLVGFQYVRDDDAAVLEALRPLVVAPGRVDLVLTAGAASTDPNDAFFTAIEELGGTVVRHGAPAHPGSMVWLARIGRTDVLGLPTCGAYSKATAADLILPRLLTGERASTRMVAGLGHGGVLVRSMRFRFPPYARDLETTDGLV